MNNKIHPDIIVLLILSLVLGIAFFFQLALHELPCALCNMQRAAFLLVGSGLLANIIGSGAKTRNYAMSAIGAMIGGGISLFQVFLDVMPGSPPKWSAFFGLHLYTWSYLLFMGIIFYSLIMIYATYAQEHDTSHSASTRRQANFLGKSILAKLSVCLLVAFAFACLTSAFLENGFHESQPGAQKHYLLLE